MYPWSVLLLAYNESFLVDYCAVRYITRSYAIFFYEKSDMFLRIWLDAAGWGYSGEDVCVDDCWNVMKTFA